MPSYYPVFLNLRQALCLVVGGGPVAERKSISLLQAGARVKVVSPSCTDDIRRMAEIGEIEHVDSVYSAHHLAGCKLVFAATNSRAVNAAAITDARANGILANSADDPESGDFIVPSLIRRGELCVAVSTGGASPMLANKITELIESQLEPELAELVELLAAMREYIKLRTPNTQVRRKALDLLVKSDAELIELIKSDRISGNTIVARNRAVQLVDLAIGHGTN